MAVVTICSDFGAQKNKVWHCFHCFPIYASLFFPSPRLKHHVIPKDCKILQRLKVETHCFVTLSLTMLQSVVEIFGPYVQSSSATEFCVLLPDVIYHIPQTDLSTFCQPPFPAVRPCLAPQAPRWHPDPQIDWDSKMWLCHTLYRPQRSGHSSADPGGQMVSWEHKCWFALLGISPRLQSYCWVSFPASVSASFLPFAHQPLKSWFSS